ncbi:MT-A70 family methyltransferase [Roseovarius ramblicola]|uniref:MT-A70 family methyltransferase n=1 Tax=Roseovarius ramblicola TaxID=2022336 RepID=A0ABV5HZP4_9RHOB
MTTGPYDIIVMDPPWHFSSNSAAKPGRNARRHYPTMRDDELRALGVADLAARPCLLFMWTTAPMLRRAIGIPEAWGFRYVTELVWPKQRIGTGYWARGQHEPCLIYKRGRFPWPGFAVFPSSLLQGEQREHSRKPDTLQAMIDGVWPEARKLEMFARRARPGWAAWGNETGKFDGAAQ